LTGNLPMCEWLQSLGLDPTVTNNQGHSPIFKAAFNGETAVVCWLLREAKLDAGAVDLGGCVAILFWALPIPFTNKVRDARMIIHIEWGMLSRSPIQSPLPMKAGELSVRVKASMRRGRSVRCRTRRNLCVVATSA
jgi:hypothetical protein